MDLTEWSKLALICILGAMSPGPSLAIISKYSIKGSRTQGFLAGIGHGLGMTFYALIAVFCLVTFFENIPPTYDRGILDDLDPSLQRPRRREKGLSF